jgi:hypothetical protein
MTLLTTRPTMTASLRMTEDEGFAGGSAHS